MEYCREKNIQLGRLIGMGYDGAATFLDDKPGQTKHLDLSLISSLVDATLNTLDDAILLQQIWFYCYKMKEKS